MSQHVFGVFKASLFVLVLVCAPILGQRPLWESTASAQQRPAVEIGMQSAPGSASDDASLGIQYRYQYLSGGAGRGTWPTWNVDGNFPLYYIQDSKDNGLTPVFTYYMICQATDQCYSNEREAIKNHLANQSIMTSYWEELSLFFEKAAQEPGTEVILHVEPDMWGFLQLASPNDSAANYPDRVQVSSTGVNGLAGLPNTLSGLAQGYFALRDYHGASNVKIAYHLSVWGTNVDIGVSDPSESEIQALGDRSAAFYNSLGQPFDLTFIDIRDRDAGYYAFYGDNSAWWNAQDYQNNIAYLSRYNSQTGQALMLWQLPYGNTLYRAMNNSWFHFQDNAVETLIGEPNYSTLYAYADAGLIGILFGIGASGTTCACDAANDGVTNPEPINGNNRISLSADDDGGYFKDRVAAFYQIAPPPTVTPQPTQAPTEEATPTQSGTTPVPTLPPLSGTATATAVFATPVPTEPNSTPTQTPENPTVPTIPPPATSTPDRPDFFPDFWLYLPFVNE